jgi:rhodanese-related sulfurtransferase
MEKSAGDLVAEAKARVENLDPDAVEAELSSGNAVLVDLREFRADPTSPYHQEPFERSRRIILHCASGGRSALGADSLQAMGYRDVAHLDGGIKAWKDAGKPVE